MPIKAIIKSKNLFDADLTVGTINTSDGTEAPYDQRLRSGFISKLPAGTYSLSANGAKLVFVYLYSTKTDYYGTTSVGWSSLPYTFTTNNDYYIRIVFRDNPDRYMSPESVSTIMLNSGSTALPYEPYGDIEKDIVRIPMIGDGPATVTGTNSVTFETDATSVIDYTIKGNLQQSGTPSSANPIYPSETGDRTENLFDKNAIVTGYAIGETGTATANENFCISDYIEVSNFDSVKAYNLIRQSTIWTFRVHGYNSDKQWLSQLYNTNVSTTVPDNSPAISIPANVKYVRLSMRYVAGQNFDIFMLSGNTSLTDYIPYGYKLTITCGNSTSNIYLQEPIRKIGDYVDAAGLSIGGANRKIKKMVLTGEEANWRKSSVYAEGFFNNGYITDISNIPVCICSHFIDSNNQAYGPGKIQLTAAGNINVWMTSSGWTLESFKQWLSDQYASGTPVTVWYVLATPETETATIPTIPTAKGQNTLSIGTTLSPSSTEVTYLGIKNTYKEGWEIRDQQDRLIWGYNSTISGASPLSFKGGGTTLTDILIGGNMVQSGTPSPSSPIYPSETGDKTGNLWDTSKIINKDGYFINSNNTIQLNANAKSIIFPVLSNTTYTLKRTGETNRWCIATTATANVSSNTPCSIVVNNVDVKLTTFTTSANDTYIMIYYCKTDASEAPSETQLQELIDTIQLVSGSYTSQTMPAYEPYGYKLPITCGNSTSNIYLQEPIRKIDDYVDISGLSIGGANRRIKKLVLDGTEEIGVHTFNNYYVYCQLSSSTDYAIENVNTCSHFPAVRISATNTSQGFGVQNKTDPSGTYVLFRWDSVPMTASGFKQWLSDQYSAGTPVTIWYVLAEPETESTTIPTILTAKGSNTLSIGTTLSPSSVSITGHIKASS